jgi:hypothetical protein
VIRVMSGTTCEHLDESELLGTHLYRPPPVSGMHLGVDPIHLFRGFVMSLGGKYHIVTEFGVTKDGPDAKQDVAIVKLEVFTSNNKFLGLEWRAPR